MAEATTAPLMRSRWRKLTGRQRWALAAAVGLALMLLQGLVFRPDSYEGHFVPLFSAQQWLYQRWYKSHSYYLGAKLLSAAAASGRVHTGTPARVTMCNSGNSGGCHDLLRPLTTASSRKRPEWCHIWSS